MDKQVNLTGDQRLYLQQIFNGLRQNNRWPTFGELDQWFTYHYPDLDICSVANYCHSGCELSRAGSRQAEGDLMTAGFGQNRSKILKGLCSSIFFTFFCPPSSYERKA